MDFKTIALVVMPFVTFFLGVLSERIKNRNQIVMEIASIDRGKYDVAKLSSFIKSFIACEFDINNLLLVLKNLKIGKYDIKELFPALEEADLGEVSKNELILSFLRELSKSSPCIKVTVVNIGRVPITVQELTINFTRSSMDAPELALIEKDTGVLSRTFEILRLQKTAKWIRRKTKVMLSALIRLLSKKIARQIYTKAMLKGIRTNEASSAKILCHEMLRLEPGESRTLEISKEQIKLAQDLLDDQKWLEMVYPSCKLVGEEKIRYSLPMFLSLLPISISGIEFELPVSFKFSP